MRSFKIPGRIGVVVLALSAVSVGLGSDGSSTGEEVNRRDRLMRLDAAQWAVVERLLELSPTDWSVFEAVVEQATAAPTAAVEVGTPPPGAAPVTTAGLPETVNTILARVNAIRSTVNALSQRTPDLPQVRALVSQVDLGGLHDLLQNVGDTLQGLVEILQDLRAGYDTFDVAAFRARLHGVLQDFASLSSLYQRLLCVDDPDVPILEVSTAPLDRLVDHAPGVTLYGLSTILDTIDPDWDGRIGAVTDAIPTAVTGFCNDDASRRLAAASRVDAAATLCNVMRPKQVGTDLALVQVKIAEGLLVFRFAKNHTPEEITVVLGADAVAGGTAGTKVKNPAYEAVDQWIDRFENLKDTLSDLKDRRKDCLDADKDVEQDLADCAKDACACAAPLSVLLQGEVPPSYDYVADLVDARIDQAENAGLPGTADARAKHDEATDATNDGTAAGYGLLCQAYQLLQQSTVAAPPSKPPRGTLRRTP